MKKYLKINKKAYGELAEEYNKKCNKNLTDQRKLLSLFIKLLKKKFVKPKVLDVGCGVGINCKILEENNLACIGIDFSPEMIKFAKKNSPKSKFIIKNFLMHKTKEKFQGIILGSFLNIFSDEDLRKVISKIKKLLVNKGLIWVSMRFYQETKEGFFVKDDYKKKVKRFGKFWRKEDFIKKITKDFEVIAEGKGYGDKTWGVLILKNRKVK